MDSRTKLTDLRAIKSTVEQYKKDEKPTFVGLCRMLKCTPNTIYRAMERGDDIAYELRDAWSYLIETWEKKLYSSQPTPAIFYLKTIRRFDLSWRDTPPPETPVVNPNEVVDNKLIIEVVTRDAKVDTKPTAE